MGVTGFCLEPKINEHLVQSKKRQLRLRRMQLLQYIVSQMGNQPGSTAYQGYQPYSSQVGQYTVPYSNSIPGDFSNMNPSTISNYYQQGFQPSKWPSATNIPQQTQSSLQPAGSGSNISQQEMNSFIQGQGGFRGSQLRSNFSAVNYNGNPGFGASYVEQQNAHPSATNNQHASQQNTFGNQQRLSNASQQSIQYYPQQFNQQQQIPQPSQVAQSSQIPQPPPLPQTKPILQPPSQLQQPGSQISQPQHQPGSLTSPPSASGLVQPQHNLQLPSQTQKHRSASGRTTPIIQSRGQLANGGSSMLRTNRSSSKQRKVRFPDQTPRSVDIMKVNLQLTKDKLDRLAMQSQQELYGIMQEIETEVNQGILSKQRLVYLLKSKKNYQKTIINIRMKQQKINQVIKEVGSLQPAEVKQIMDEMNKKIDLFHQEHNIGWRAPLQNESQLSFKTIVDSGLSDSEVMGAYGHYYQQVQTAISNLPPGTSTSSVVTISSIGNNMPQTSKSISYDYNGYIGSKVNPALQMTFNDPANNQSSSGQSGLSDGVFRTAKFANPSSSMRSEVDNGQYGLNVISASQVNIMPVFPQPSPTNAMRSVDANVRSQVPKLADFLQSKIIPPPPQSQPFMPPLPTANYFAK